MKDFWKKIKTRTVALVTPEIYIVLLIILVGFGSFGLGRLSAREENKFPVRIVEPGGETASSTDAFTASAIEAQGTLQGKSPTIKVLSQNGLIVASKSGSKYYFPWCAGAKRIAEANKIWFASEQEAQTAGLTRAASCTQK